MGLNYPYQQNGKHCKIIKLNDKLLQCFIKVIQRYYFELQGGNLECGNDSPD
jgi:hypothetical protein